MVPGWLLASQARGRHDGQSHTENYIYAATITHHRMLVLRRASLRADPMLSNSADEARRIFAAGFFNSSRIEIKHASA